MIVTVSRVETIPYSNEELRLMKASERHEVIRQHRQKVIGEEIIEKIKSAALDELRCRIRELCIDYHPTPIILTGTEELKDDFLISRRYKQNERKAIFETIVFKYKSIKKLEDTWERLNSDPLTRKLFFRRVGMKSNGDYHALAERQKQMLEGKLKLSLRDVLGSYLKIQLSKATHPSIGFSSKRVQLDDPKVILDDNTTILFRLIGRDLTEMHNHRNYYCKLNNIREPYYYFSNLSMRGTGMWT